MKTCSPAHRLNARCAAMAAISGAVAAYRAALFRTAGGYIREPTDSAAAFDYRVRTCRSRKGAGGALGTAARVRRIDRVVMRTPNCARARPTCVRTVFDT